jgi:glycosyltransferase involved in cell wall biosynthesis/peptidoglycan/xylan/chitin deacetylase (PgdA/CDA1 family)
MTPHNAVALSDAGARPLRVLFIIDTLSVGGAELCLLRLTQHLPREHVQCRVLTFQSRPDCASLLEAFDCPLDHWPISTVFSALGLKTALRLRNLIRKEQIDVVHTFFETSDLWAAPIAKLSGAKVIVSSRRDMGFLRTPRHSFAYRILHGIFDQVQTVSESVREWTIQTDGTDPERTVTVYNGIDPELNASAAEASQFRETLQIGPERLVITTVANLRRIKGIDVLVRAAALVGQEFPEALFLVAGDDSHGPKRAYADEVKGLAKSLGLERSVRFLGHTDRVPELLALSDVFVLPSRSEGLSNALLEAMRSGLPCIATSVGGNPEVVVDHWTGYLVAPDDPNALAERILKLLRDPQLRERMGRASRQRILAEFTVGKMTETVANAYRVALRWKGFLAPDVSSSTGPQGDTAFSSERKTVAGWTFSLGANVSQKVARLAGLNAVFRRSMLRDRFLVLCYHGVLRQPPPWESAYAIDLMDHDFAEQLDFLRDRFHLMSASELVAIAEGRQNLVPESAMITFDDGYLNNLTVAAPLLRSRGIPAIFNVSTGYIGKDSLLWADEVFLRVMHWPESVVPLPEGKACALPKGANRRVSIAARIQEQCKLLANHVRLAYLELLRNGSSLAEDAHLAEVYRFMTWDDVRELSAQGFEIGSHTVTHPILSRIGAEQLQQELNISKERIESELGRECRIIAYPNGLARDVGEAAQAAAAAANYRVGLMLCRGLAAPRNWMAIDRINVPGGQKKSVFESRAAGIYVLRQRLLHR